MIEFLGTHWIAYISVAITAVVIWLIMVLVKRWKRVTNGLACAERFVERFYGLSKRVDDLEETMSFIYMPEDKLRKTAEKLTTTSVRMLYGGKDPYRDELKRREMMRQEGQNNETLSD